MKTWLIFLGALLLLRWLFNRWPVAVLVTGGALGGLALFALGGLVLATPEAPGWLSVLLGLLGLWLVWASLRSGWQHLAKPRQHELLCLAWAIWLGAIAGLMAMWFITIVIAFWQQSQFRLNLGLFGLGFLVCAAGGTALFWRLMSFFGVRDPLRRRDTPPGHTEILPGGLSGPG